MKDVRVDDAGEFRCWKCGGKNFTEKRTFRSKMMIGVGALLTKKKLKCKQCGKYNDVGSARPHVEPIGRRATPATPPAPSVPAGWYPDPDGTPVRRYWDGGAWTEQTAPADGE